MGYRKFIAKMQKFVVELKKEEKKLKQQDEKDKDPFGRKEAAKVEVKRKCEYAEADKGKELQMHEIKRMWCHSDEEWKYTKGVQRLMKAMKWEKEESRSTNTEGGHNLDRALRNLHCARRRK